MSEIEFTDAPPTQVDEIPAELHQGCAAVVDGAGVGIVVLDPRRRPLGVVPPEYCAFGLKPVGNYEPVEIS